MDKKLYATLSNGNTKYFYNYIKNLTKSDHSIKELDNFESGQKDDRPNRHCRLAK